MSDQKLHTIKRHKGRKQTISDAVLDRIRDAILNGLLAPGAHIDQTQLAASLNVSLVPVREALKKLEGDGFVQIIPRQGAFVAQSSISDMRELYFAREILEAQAAYHSIDRLDESDLTKLNTLGLRMTDALENEQFAAFLDMDREFHFTIYECAGSQYLTNTIANLWQLGERYRYRYLFLKDHRHRLQTEHRAILTACYAYDREALRMATACHVSQTFDAVRNYLIFYQPEQVHSG